MSKRLPSIVVEPTDGPEVESGELRWPPEPSSPDAQTKALGEEDCILTSCRCYGVEKRSNGQIGYVKATNILRSRDQVKTKSETLRLNRDRDFKGLRVFES